MNNSREMIYYDEMTTPIGILTLFTSETGICLVEFGSFSLRESFVQQWSRNWTADAEFIRDEQRLLESKTQLEQYFSGSRKQFDLPMDQRGTPFQLQVWAALADIPYGETRSYKQMAEVIERPKAIRAVGGANNKNPISIIVPCHRVIGAEGSLIGFGGGLEIKSHLLSIEGSLPERYNPIKSK
jgi:epoxyqueuosine reductase